MEKVKSIDAKVREEIMSTLDRLGGLTVEADSLTFQGDRIVLPASMEGDVQGAITFLEDWREQQERSFEYSRTYAFRPDDGAAAFDRAMRLVFGTSGIGRATFTMFGVQPPELRTIPVGVGRTIQVPWGRVSFGPLGATFEVGATGGRNGPRFHLSVSAPRKHRRRIEGFFDMVQRELESQSIYRGQAITGGMQPEYVDVSTVDPARVVYSAETLRQLDANLWTLLEHTEAMRALGIPLKRAVLVEGPYGTGKTLAGALTAQRAVANGWTYVICRPGQDDLMTTLETAKLYAPAVVWFEDIDIIGGADGSSMFLSRLLDALDGMMAKGTEVIAGFTTNHVERLQKGLLRPGRIDTVIHIGELDEPGIRRLVEVVIPSNLLAEGIDWASVATAFRGYVPAFAREAIDRALRYSISRNDGQLLPVNTVDLVSAAEGLRAQHKIMNEAAESEARTTIEGILTDRVEEVLSRAVPVGWHDALEIQERDVATVGHDNGN